MIAWVITGFVVICSAAVAYNTFVGPWARRTFCNVFIWRRSVGRDIEELFLFRSLKVGGIVKKKRGRTNRRQKKLKIRRTY